MHPSNLPLIAPPGAWPKESTSTQQSSGSTQQSSSSTIWQVELQRYKQLQKCEKEKEELAESLKERYGAGTEVEPGALSVNVKKVKTRRLTKDNLTPLLGEDRVARLIELIEPNTERRLTVK